MLSTGPGVTLANRRKYKRTQTRVLNVEAFWVQDCRLQRDVHFTPQRTLHYNTVYILFRFYKKVYRRK